MATISLQRIVAESADGRAANEQLQALAKKMSGDLAAKQKEFQQTPPNTGENRQAELQRLAQQSQTEYANTQRELQTALRTKMNPLVASVAAAHGVDLVLNSDVAVVWAAPALDVTNDVLARLNGTPKK